MHVDPAMLVFHLETERRNAYEFLDLKRPSFRFVKSDAEVFIAVFDTEDVH
jgi:hypothetical protein